MRSQRITITFPEKVVAIVRKRARTEKKPVSRVIREAVEESERERIRQKMIAGYKAMAEENERLAEEWLPVSLETWPRD